MKEWGEKGTLADLPDKDTNDAAKLAAGGASALTAFLAVGEAAAPAAATTESMATLAYGGKVAADGVTLGQVLSGAKTAADVTKAVEVASTASSASFWSSLGSGISSAGSWMFAHPLLTAGGVIVITGTTYYIYYRKTPETLVDVLDNKKQGGGGENGGNKKPDKEKPKDIRDAAKGGESTQQQRNNGDKHPSTPTGGKGEQFHVLHGTNKPGTINGREYCGHALDRMQERGVFPSMVEDAIKNGVRSAGNRGARMVYTHPATKVTVVTESTGEVVSVRFGGLV